MTRARGLSADRNTPRPRHPAAVRRDLPAEIVAGLRVSDFLLAVGGRGASVEHRHMGDAVRAATAGGSPPNEGPDGGAPFQRLAAVALSVPAAPSATEAAELRAALMDWCVVRGAVAPAARALPPPSDLLASDLLALAAPCLDEGGTPQGWWQR